jgi:acyl-CoA dehydrogenase
VPGRGARRRRALAAARGALIAGDPVSSPIRFDPIRLPPEAQRLRAEVRGFLRAELGERSFDPRSADPSAGFDREFSRKMGARGWIGMTWPKRYGGGERSFLERYVVTEECRVANAPVGLHFTADRQSGAILLKYASERLKSDILPRITRGECCFCIGMSEPGSGSDLFAAKTRATRAPGGWSVTGTKVWTSGAQHADYMIGLFRTSPATKEDRRHGLTQFLVDMRSPGIQVSPIADMSGQKHFNEVHFEDLFVPDECVLGKVDLAWQQATSELAFERSGPERFLETAYLLFELVRVLGAEPDSRGAEGLGRLVAQLHVLRRMSVSVNGMLQAGREPVLEGSLVKDVGTLWEQALPQRARELAAFAEPERKARLDALLGFATNIAPKLTIQGGTTEVLRGIIARGLGLR